MSDTVPLVMCFDAEPLASYERKLDLLRDRVAAVAGGYETGLYLCGPGGTGKSHTVLRHLDALKASYKLHNSRMTGRGLYRALENSPDVIHVLEDMERLTQDKDAQGVLRSALWAQPGHERIVTWTTGTQGEERFTFRGGLILIANRPMADLPELRALATRITIMRLEATDTELTALMYSLAMGGYRREGKTVISAPECVKITEHLITECRAVGCQLDMRLQPGAYSDYLLWEGDHSTCQWEDLVSARVREAAHHFRHERNTVPREERRTWRRNVLRQILEQTADADEQLKLYVEQTGSSRADFFRRKREVQTGEFDGE